MPRRCLGGTTIQADGIGNELICKHAGGFPPTRLRRQGAFAPTCLAAGLPAADWASALAPTFFSVVMAAWTSFTIEITLNSMQICQDSSRPMDFYTIIITQAEAARVELGTLEVILSYESLDFW